jgi:hypothetical protein
MKNTKLNEIQNELMLVYDHLEKMKEVVDTLKYEKQVLKNEISYLKQTSTQPVQ